MPHREAHALSRPTAAAMSGEPLGLQARASRRACEPATDTGAARVKERLRHRAPDPVVPGADTVGWQIGFLMR